MDKGTEKLLTKIQKAVLCLYISDHRSAGTLFGTRAKQRILEIPDNRYSSSAWSEAASYITRKPNSFSTASDKVNHDKLIQILRE